VEAAVALGEQLDILETPAEVVEADMVPLEILRQRSQLLIQESLESQHNTVIPVVNPVLVLPAAQVVVLVALDCLDLVYVLQVELECLSHSLIFLLT
jgi:hypothetical protein